MSQRPEDEKPPSGEPQRRGDPAREGEPTEPTQPAGAEDDRLREALGRDGLVPL